MNETIVINEGTTFMVTDSLGNVPRGSPLGLFRSDTRYLNKYVLRINGRDMIPLSFTRRGYIANISLTNPELKGPEIPRSRNTRRSRRGHCIFSGPCSSAPIFTRSSSSRTRTAFRCG